ncbi:FO synthase [Conyzicola lurida]|uniref:7,8-didemethyl-8-hydroxy-5-deazariboflavin synthase n=1 Tax=Conyzicola lurida TaxID=1172621 RepID=A0A841ALM6_9MICO|nr:7,8-didemethyl-8-hydroxy-5-deazariboflavin synthase CofG [Conyzicola lurida]MBB5844890.1 FO synthase [Conyzicola lurida]
MTAPSLSEIRDTLTRLESSTDVSERDAEILFSARGDELDRLLAVSSTLRDGGLEASGRTGVITYSKKVFIPITFLCQDRCHYCTFVENPGALARMGKPSYMSPDDILEVARAGAAMGCKEALFTLGDRPENRWPSARDWLTEHGYASTIDYIRAMAKLVLEETGLLPHLNPGIMSFGELQALRPVAPSMGMMLETTATRLWSEKGAVHYGSPDKDPALRLRVLEDAGRSKVPFTTGVLLGIGENNAERAEALFAIRASHERHGHIQETIVQNFRAKEKTAMQNEDDLALQEYVAAVAVARVVMGPDATIQAPPNLTDATELGLLIRAGIDDWGGVSPLTADHVNPERPWPELDDLAALTAAAGFELRERLTAHPPYMDDAWLDPRLRAHVDALVAPSGLADKDAPVLGRPWAAASVASTLSPVLRRAAVDPAGLSDDDYVALLGSDGAELEALAALADEVRVAAVGDRVSFVINRNLDSSLVSDPALIGDLADEAAALGATEICVQGLVPVGGSYFDVVAAIRSRQPSLHLHAFRPTEVVDGAERLGITVAEFYARLRDAGVGTVPGTGARILDDRIRAALSENTDPPAAEWIATIEAAHHAGFRSTATMVYGHIETAADQVAHLRALSHIQDRTGGFTEFIAMPFVPVDSPPVAGARPGPTVRESRALHAVARLMLHGRIDHIQAAWTKLGLATSQAVLRGGADDLGGLLLDGTIAPEAGAEAHRSLTIADVERVAAEIGREARQRTTDYGSPTPEQLAFARRADAPPASRLHLPLRERRAALAAS